MSTHSLIGNGVRRARSALLLALLTSCSGGVEPSPADNPGGAASEAGAAAEPNSAGASAASGGNSSSAGAASGGTAAEAGNAPSDGGESGGGAAPQLREEPAYASSVESFEPGIGAGYNQDKLPGIVLGPPHPVGNGRDSGSLDVLSLGAGGQIVLAFGELGIVDGPGPDLIVFENAFWPGGDASAVFYELAEVSVSEDGETWHAFGCDRDGDGQGLFPGCAGFTPTLAYDPATLIPLDPARSGGDAFDLADVGLSKARFVRLRDLETLPPGGTTSGFDLDAVVAIHAQ